MFIRLLRRFVVLQLLIASQAVSLGKEALGNTPSDNPSPRDVYSTFFSAVLRGDSTRAKEATIRDDASDQLVDGLTAMMASAHRAEEAAVARFGEKSREDFMWHFDPLGKLEYLSETFHGDQAILSSVRPDLRVTFTQMKGRWKLDPNSLFDSFSTQHNAARMSVLVKLFNQLTTEIDASKYPNVQSASSVILKRMVMTASRPTTMPDHVQLAADLRISLKGTALVLNGSSVPFPVDADKLIELLGEPSRVSGLDNTIMTWDKFGLMAYEKNPEANRVFQLSIALGKKDFHFWPNHEFTGKLNVDGAEISAAQTIKQVNDKKSGAKFSRGYVGWWEIDTGGVLMTIDEPIDTATFDEFSLCAHSQGPD